MLLPAVRACAYLWIECAFFLFHCAMKICQLRDLTNTEGGAPSQYHGAVSND
jgi:hypothetical protein